MRYGIREVHAMTEGRYWLIGSKLKCAHNGHQPGLS
jgi:hypothetical protein